MAIDWESCVNMLPRIICIVGPTSSGKTSLGIEIAKACNGEIINADSRQIFKKLSIGTGKPDGAWKNVQGTRAYAVQGIAHHLMDVLEPTMTWTVTEWRDEAIKKIEQIIKRGHVPIIVGGTGLYIRALIDNPQYPAVAPQIGFREAMASKKLQELVEMLLQLDPDAKEIIDLKNPRRVLRALEVATFTGVPFTAQQAHGKQLVQALQIARSWSREDLNERIDAEVDAMLNRGWMEEIRALQSSGLSRDCPAMQSIGYKELFEVVEGKIAQAVAVQNIKIAIHQYAKRQCTWFQRDTRIHWVQNEAEGKQKVQSWLSIDQK